MSAPSGLPRDGWTLLPAAAGAIRHPDQLPADGWRAASVPGTVAESLALPLSWEADLEAEDWWYRCTFSRPDRSGPLRLRFDGLATLAEVWLNGERVLTTGNMFRVYTVAVSLQPENTLALCFRSLSAAMSRRMPRPRWRTGLVEQQRLRFFRTTLLGRIPGWTPSLPPIGPWREVALERVPLVDDLTLRAEAVGTGGRLRISGRVDPSVGRIALRLGATVHALDAPDPDSGHLEAELRLPDVALWWPHTHGTPHLHDCALLLTTPDGVLEQDCGRVGFRAVTLDRTGGRVSLRVNDQPVFCRGACWSAEDVRSLDGAPGQAEATLRLAAEGGLNMLRVGGTMTYASPALLAACDALGILVWQDFMFANMDYPFDDPAFAAEIEAEVAGLLRRLAAHPCVAVYCGGSEIEQQAAMLGLPPEQWSSPFFTEQLPARCAQAHPGTVYFPSTPTGGALPFHTAEGLTHYYGVGAYRRPLHDARLADVRFTPECLGFSNVPDGEGLPLPHHPAWKAGVPRDSGAGWDFEDIRDHYLERLFSVNPIALRSVDPERYLALSRAVSGEVMLRVFAEWRRPGGRCGGGLVWFLKDLRPGAGWGVIDSSGQPKAAYWYLRRAWARRAVLITDEGLQGLDLHLLNEESAALEGTVELELLADGRSLRAASAPVSIPARGALTLSGDALMGGFTDLSHAYRFGPPAHDVVLARLRGPDGAVLSQDAFFPGGYSLPLQREPGLEGSCVTAAADGTVVMTLRSAVFLQSVAIQCGGFSLSDNHFHLAPGIPREIVCTPRPDARSLKAWVSALNMAGFLTVRA